jgi:hypothetical protein
MIFKFFKRSPPPAPAKPAPKRSVKKKSTSRADLPTEPSQLPEIVEGSEHTDWALWEDSVAALDSQMQSLNPQVVKRFIADETPTDFQPVEAFATVKKKDP